MEPECITMQALPDSHYGNPLTGLIDDEVYEVLEQYNLLSEKGVRDYKIRRAFRTMRNQDIPAFDAIELLRDEYPYLQFDTIRKIVYRMNGLRR